MTVRIIGGDCLAAIDELLIEGVEVDSVVTDPPYHLTARTSRFGKPGSAPPQHGRDGAMGRLSKGFMGKAWDGGDIAFRPETWARIATVLRPGGFMLVFGGPRTYHRMACAIEDSGLVIQDCLLWLYGTGFPKRRDAMKPAYEPICMAYKPGGARTLQVDECRIHGDDAPGGEYRIKRLNPGASVNKTGEWKQEREFIGFQQPGRWPANIAHDGSDEVVSMFPDSSNGHHPAKRNGRSMWAGEGGGLNGNSGPERFMNDGGSAARFFWSPKANKKDRAGSKHPTVKPVRLVDWLVPLVTPIGGTVLDPFAGSGTTGVAANNCGRDAILIEREEEYLADIRRRFAVGRVDRLTAAVEVYADAFVL